MDRSEKEEILNRYYFNPKNAGALSGPIKLFRVIPKTYPGQFKLGFVKRWLSNQDSYSIQKQVRHRFKTANVRVTFINEQWDIDLADMSNIAKENNSVKYLFSILDIFSRKLWMIALTIKPPNLYYKP